MFTAGKTVPLPYKENTAELTAVYTFVAYDPEGGGRNLLPVRGRFGQVLNRARRWRSLTFATSPNFEAPGLRTGTTCTR